MSLGERGGWTNTADEGFEALEVFKATIADQVRADILGWLDSHDTWHRDDLRIPLAPADKNVLGAVVNGLIRSGLIVETGERRRSADPAAHSRKSNVYRLRAGGDGRQVREPTTSVVRTASAVISGQQPERGHRFPSGASPEGVADPAPSGPPRLFDVDELPGDEGGYYEREAA